MKRKIYVLLVLTVIAFFSSCNNSGTSNKANESPDNKIVQKDDGTISLKVEKAECYADMENPSSNTAEWNVVVSKTGRFNVWLSSATKDTTNLQYKHSVMLNVLDNSIEGLPEVDRVVSNSNDVTYPYFRADSFLGSLFLSDTGLYNIQVISEKIIPDNLPLTDESKLIAVMLTPVASDNRN